MTAADFRKQVSAKVYWEAKMWDWFRTCANCSNSYGAIDLYCENCWSLLWKQQQFKERSILGGSVRAFSLWTWKEGPSMVQNFVRKQKGICLLSARKKIVERYLSLLPSPPPQGLFYVTPKDKKTDHGSEWAKAFSVALGIPTYRLVLPSKGNYKTKNRQERWNERAVLNSYPLGFLQHYWFVDDVLTTGATAQAVWASLGRPDSFKAVTIVYKEYQNE